MVEISSSGSGRGPGRVIAPGYQTMLRRYTQHVCASRRSNALSLGVLRRLGGSTFSANRGKRIEVRVIRSLLVPGKM